MCTLLYKKLLCWGGVSQWGPTPNKGCASTTPVRNNDVDKAVNKKSTRFVGAARDGPNTIYKVVPYITLYNVKPYGQGHDRTLYVNTIK